MKLIESFLDNLSADLGIDYRFLIIYLGIDGIDSSQVVKSKLYDTIEAVNEGTLIHYLKALIGYYNYWHIIATSQSRAMSYILKEPGKSEKLKNELKYIIGELNEGKKLLSKEDITNIEFFDECIKYIQQKEIDRINKLEQDEIEKIQRDERERNGLCITCGAKLGFFEKLSGRTCKKHKK